MKRLNEINIRTDIRAGDLGMITYLHGVLYEAEYQYGVSFESIVAGGLHESGFVISEEKPSTAFGKAVIEQRYDIVF